jgi:hypothetical protein
MAGGKNATWDLLVKVDFTPLSASFLPAVRAFNQRLTMHGEPPFLLPQEGSATDVTAEGHPAGRHYVAVDQRGEVRGGMLLTECRSWLQNRVVPVVNIQSPLSEGIVNRQYSGVSLQMLKFVTSLGPYAYAVGMGDEQRPWPRLLRAAGWTVRHVPFRFSVLDTRRFLDQVGPLRSGYWKWLARMASVSGLGSAAFGTWHFLHRDTHLRGYWLETASAWPNGLDSVWQSCCPSVSFSVLRDEAALTGMYPHTQPRLKRFVLRSAKGIVGWSVGLVTKMEDNPNFGDLVVGTILDGLARREHLRGLLALTRSALKDLGAEVVLTNQSHSDWLTDLSSLGFLGSSSNYLVALSKPLAAALRSEVAALDHIHVNRGDGDGRNNL